MEHKYYINMCCAVLLRAEGLREAVGCSPQMELLSFSHLYWAGESPDEDGQTNINSVFPPPYR